MNTLTQEEKRRVMKFAESGGRGKKRYTSSLEAYGFQNLLDLLTSTDDEGAVKQWDKFHANKRQKLSRAKKSHTWTVPSLTY